MNQSYSTLSKDPLTQQYLMIKAQLMDHLKIIDSANTKI